MDKYSLPTSTTIKDKQVEFYSDYRDILHILEVFNDADLLDLEKVEVALDLFYKTDDYKYDIPQAVKEMNMFIDGCNDYSTISEHRKPLYSWEQDYSIIVSPVNKVLGFDCRGTEYLHWWTFLSAFMEIGECTFNTYVSIRDKLNRNIKLEKHEERILKDNREQIILKERYDSTTQSLMDEIMGKES